MNPRQLLSQLIEEAEQTVRSTREQLLQQEAKLDGLRAALNALERAVDDFGVEEETPLSAGNPEGETSIEMRRRIDAIKQAMYADGRARKFADIQNEANRLLGEDLTRFQILGAMKSPLGEEMFEPSNIRGWWRLRADYRTMTPVLF